MPKKIDPDKFYLNNKEIASSEVAFDAKTGLYYTQKASQRIYVSQEKIYTNTKTKMKSYLLFLSKNEANKITETKIDTTIDLNNIISFMINTKDSNGVIYLLYLKINPQEGYKFIISNFHLNRLKTANKLAERFELANKIHKDFIFDVAVSNETYYRYDKTPVVPPLKHYAALNLLVDKDEFLVVSKKNANLQFPDGKNIDGALHLNDFKIFPFHTKTDSFKVATYKGELIFMFNQYKDRLRKFEGDKAKFEEHCKTLRDYIKNNPNNDNMSQLKLFHDVNDKLNIIANNVNDVNPSEMITNEIANNINDVTPSEMITNEIANNVNDVNPSEMITNEITNNVNNVNPSKMITNENLFAANPIVETSDNNLSFNLANQSTATPLRSNSIFPPEDINKFYEQLHENFDEGVNEHVKETKKLQDLVRNQNSSDITDEKNQPPHKKQKTN